MVTLIASALTWTSGAVLICEWSQLDRTLPQHPHMPRWDFVPFAPRYGRVPGGSFMQRLRFGVW